MEECEVCGGTGNATFNCPTCNGNGWVDERCEECQGTGEQEIEQEKEAS